MIVKVALWLAVLGVLSGILWISLGLADQLGDRVGNALVWTQIVLFCLWGGGCIYEAIEERRSHHC